MYEAWQKWGFLSGASGEGEKYLNRNQKAAARGLSLAAYLLSAGGQWKGEGSIRKNLPAYGEVYEASLEENEDRGRAGDALRKQLRRDVETLAEVGIGADIEGDPDGRRYRLPASRFSPTELELSPEERAVLIGALRALRRDFPYAGPLRLALANLIGAASAGAGGGEDTGAAFAAVSTRNDEAVARRVASLESAVSRQKRVRFDYYSISRDETSKREVEPYALSLLDGTWYMTGWDTRREDVRQFRLSRIRSRIVFATKRERGDFELPEDFERHLAGPRAPWQLGEPDETARLRVSAEVFDYAYASHGSAVSLEKDVHEPVLVTRYSEERQLAAWILSLGEGARVLSPDSLIQRVTEGLNHLTAAHGEERA